MQRLLREGVVRGLAVAWHHVNGHTRRNLGGKEGRGQCAQYAATQLPLLQKPAQEERQRRGETPRPPLVRLD